MKIFKLIPEDWNLSKKLTTLMLTIFLGGIIVSSVIYYNLLLENAQNELNKQSNTMISLVDAIRKYNLDNVTPLLEKQAEEEIILAALPTVAASQVFDIFTRVYKDDYGEYLYKDAMINPTNPKDQATDEERNIIEKLSQQDQLVSENEIQGFLRIDGKNKFYTARPMKITQVSCLSCHSSLEKSPKSLQVLYKQRNYGDHQGFGWELNKVIGTKIIYVPADQVYQNAKQFFLVVIGVFTGIFAIAIFLVNLWLKQYVVRPINRITKVAEAVSLGGMDANFDKQYNDEVGRLVDAFTRMKTSLEIAIKRLNNKGNRSSE